MSNPINLVHGVELQDASGHSLGLFRSEADLKRLAAERDRLRKELTELEAKLSATTDERDQLRAALAVVSRERDEYLQWVYALTPKEAPTIAPEELAALEKNGVPFDQVVAEIDFAIDCRHDQV